MNYNLKKIKVSGEFLMNPNEQFIKSADIIWQEIHGEYVLLDPKRSKTHSLNDTAFALWNSFENAASVVEVSRKMAMDFECDFETILSHSNDLTLQFFQKGLIFKKNESI